MLVYPFSSWSSFDQGWGLGLPEGFRADYEKMYGKGSFNKNVGKILEQHTYNLSLIHISEPTRPY